jgi:lysophospholipase L1-like esterase
MASFWVAGNLRRSLRCALLAAAVTLWPFGAPAWGATQFQAARPAVRVEYWQKRLAQITAQLKDRRSLPSTRLVFLGDSITDFWGLARNPWVTGATGGRAVWNESFAGSPAENLGLNLGVSGDRTEHVLYRLLPKSAGGLGELDAAGLHPEFVVLLVGINNTWDPETPVVASVFDGIRAVISAVHDRQPKAVVILESLLPTNDALKNRETVLPVNRRLLELAASPPFADYVVYLDLYPRFVDASGAQLSGYFMDGLHPNESGYRVWRDTLLPCIDSTRRSGVHAKPCAS